MKKTVLVLIFFLLTVIPCGAAVDPILIDKPDPRVFECTPDLVLELLVDPVIDHSTGGRYSEKYFFFLTVEFLYLQEQSWDGLDKGSFLLKHTDSDGQEEFIPLNYMMTSMMGMKNGWKTMADKLDYVTLLKLTLVFDVDTTDKTGWALIFRPSARGKEPACTLEIPLLYFRDPNSGEGL